MEIIFCVTPRSVFTDSQNSKRVAQKVCNSRASLVFKNKYTINVNPKKRLIIIGYY